MSLDPVAIGHDCGTAADFERAVLDGLGAYVGFDVAFLSMVGAEATPTVSGFDAPMVERAVAGGADYAVELMPVKRAALARRGVAVDTDVLGWERVQKARYYREVAARVGGRHSLIACLVWQGRPIGMLMLGRTGRTAPAFSDDEIARVEAALPALAATRTAFGLPTASGPLPGSRSGNDFWKRFGWERERVLSARRTPGATISVRDRAGFREMVAARDGAELVWSRAALADPAVSGWPYIELFHVAAALAKERSRALFIGCGGAVAVRQFARMYAGIRCDVVECEPVVVALAREFFALDAIPGVTVHLADGAEFIARAAPASWDVVVIDAYDASETDAAFSTRRFSATLARALRPGGAVALNVIGTLASAGLVERTVRALARVFDEVRIVPVTAVGECLGVGEFARDAFRNVVIIGVRSRSGC